MKELIEVRANHHYTQVEKQGSFELNPVVELIVVYTDGKQYSVTKDGYLKSEFKFSESRMLINPELLGSLIAQLQMHQSNLNKCRNNAEQINSLIKIIVTADEAKQESKPE